MTDRHATVAASPAPLSVAFPSAGMPTDTRIRTASPDGACAAARLAPAIPAARDVRGNGRKAAIRR